jgi:hypothetical protein
MLVFVHMLGLDHMLDFGRGFGLRGAGAGSHGLGSRENTTTQLPRTVRANLVRGPFQPQHFSVRLFSLSLVADDEVVLP